MQFKKLLNSTQTVKLAQEKLTKVKFVQVSRI